VVKRQSASLLPSFLATSLTRVIAYCYQCYRSVVCLPVSLSVCLSHSCIVLKRLKILTWFSFHTTAPCLSHIVLKFGLHFLPKFLLQSGSSPVYLSVRDIWWQIAAELLEIVQWPQWRAYRNPPLLFRMVPSLTSCDLHFPKMANGGPQMHPTTNFATRAATWRICWRAMSTFAKLLCPLFLSFLNFVFFMPVCLFPGTDTDDVRLAGRVLQWWCTVLCRRVWTTRCGRNLTWSSSVCCISSGQQNTCRISTGCRRKTSQVYAFMAQRNRSHFK